MRIREYPYGRVTKTLCKAVTWLNRNKRRLEKQYCRECAFDFPYYWDMPKIISSRLSSDEVDWLQLETYDWDYRLTEEEYNSKIERDINE